MIVLLLGSGGREHAMAWKIAQSPLVSRLYVLPGSDGIAALDKVECLPGSANDTATVLAAAQRLKPALIAIGPEAPLEAGVSDALVKAGFPVAAPSQAAARLETSKIFSKQFMTSVGIPTAAFTVCNSYDEAVDALKAWAVEKEGVVIKADGLATGKGVVVTHDRAEAETTLFDFMKNPGCTVKADKLLLEKMVTGKEVSAFALCDGETFIPLGYACDYKRVNDGNTGHNTGGMGGYTPPFENGVGWPSAKVRQFANDGIFKKTVDGMKKNGMPYKGFLYAGLMIEGDEVNVIEFNARFGDPEAQILLPLIEDDLVPLLQAAASGALAKAGPVSLRKSSAVHVVMVSGGYPDVMGAGMRLGEKISLPESPKDNALLFIAGAKKNNGDWVNTGGRVLGVTALGPDIEEARKNAYKAIENIHFNGAHWRKDIGR